MSTLIKSVIPEERIENKIFLIRGKKVMLDKDLATLYGVRTGNFNKSVQRNKNRFPDDFMFQLNKEETDVLRFQFGISKEGRGGRRYLPYVFTEQGVAMLSSVLNSERAIEVNIQIMRVFVRIKEMIMSHKDLVRKMEALENKYDGQFKEVFEAIRRLMTEEQKPKTPIGFHVK